MATLIDSNGNYVPLQRHPDPPTENFNLAGGQLVEYFGASPTADGLTPVDPNSAAMAYKDGAPLVGWDKVNHVWFS